LADNFAAPPNGSSREGEEQTQIIKKTGRKGDRDIEKNKEVARNNKRAQQGRKKSSWGSNTCTFNWPSPSKKEEGAGETGQIGCFRGTKPDMYYKVCPSLNQKKNSSIQHHGSGGDGQWVHTAKKKWAEESGVPRPKRVGRKGTI